MRIGPPRSDTSRSMLIFAFGLTFSASSMCLAQTGNTPPKPFQAVTKPSAETLKDFLEHQTPEAEVRRELELTYPKLKADLKSENGWLLYVEIFIDENNENHPGRLKPVMPLAQGRTANEAAVNYYLSNELEPTPPWGMLVDDKKSYLIWATRSSDELAFTKISYPFSRVTLDTGSQAAGLELSEDQGSWAANKTIFTGNGLADFQAVLGKAQTETARLQKMLVRADTDARRLSAAKEAIQRAERQIDRQIARRDRRTQEISTQLVRDQQRAKAAEALIEAYRTSHSPDRTSLDTRETSTAPTVPSTSAPPATGEAKPPAPPPTGH